MTSKPSTGGTSPARQLVRRYRFGYDQAAHDSLLASVQAEGRCASPVAENGSGDLPDTACPRLPPLSFEYQRVAGAGDALYDNLGQMFEGFDHSIQKLANSPPYSLDEAHTGLMDVNADGLPDVLVSAAGFFNGNHGLYLNGASPALCRGSRGSSRCRSSRRPSVDRRRRAVARRARRWPRSISTPTASSISSICRSANAIRSSRPSASGANGFEMGGARESRRRRNKTSRSTSPATRPTFACIDVNGDGLVDVVYSTATAVQTFFSLGRYPGGDGQFGSARGRALSTATISNDPVVFCTPWSSTPVRFSDPDTQLADLNGDGLADIARVRDGQVLLLARSRQRLLRHGQSRRLRARGVRRRSPRRNAQPAPVRRDRSRHAC